MNGKIIRGIAGFYYVHVNGMGIFECKAKGIFRNNNIKPLVGDNVQLEILDDENMLGNISKILPRKNCLFRPAVANIDQAVVIFAASYPKPDLNLLDKFLLTMATFNIPAIICLNKSDSVDKDIILRFVKNYKDSGCIVYITSTVTGDGINKLKESLLSKTTVFAGPSGVGKSSILNKLLPEAKMAVGNISNKIKRGKHTTRHSELFNLENDTYIMDTPGFTSLKLPEVEKENLREYYPEFEAYIGKCKFLRCVHINEPKCAIKKAVDDGNISQVRYDNYRQFYDEINNIKKY